MLECRIRVCTTVGLLCKNALLAYGHAKQSHAHPPVPKVAHRNASRRGQQAPFAKGALAKRRDPLIALSPSAVAPY
jgi:hypothetical protein